MQKVYCIVVQNRIYFKCSSYDGINVTDLGPTTEFAHSAASVNLGNYRGSPFIAGGGKNENRYQTEVLDRIKGEWPGEWIRKADFPFNAGFYYSAIASLPDKVYVIGGQRIGAPGGKTDIIAQFKDDTWTLVGRMSTRRYGHNVIVSDNDIIIVGGSSAGYDPEYTDIWNTETQSITTIGPKFTAYFGPALLLVDENYCNSS